MTRSKTVKFLFFPYPTFTISYGSKILRVTRNSYYNYIKLRLIMKKWNSY